MNAQKKPGAQAGGDVPAEVAKLMAAGKLKQAVELAKTAHKKQPTEQSQQLLVDAYVGRIQQFQSRGAFDDAQTLIQLVTERFPAHRARLAALRATEAAAQGHAADLVAPLADPHVAPDVLERIETAIRRQLLDLQSLADARTLPPEHPLRVEAAAAWKAFTAVTSGPVSDEQIELAMIPRRSPLVGWKMLIRAIAAFHRHEDEVCLRTLEFLPADSAVARLVPVMRATIKREPVGAGAAKALQIQAAPLTISLRDALAAAEQASTNADVHSLRRALADVMRAAAVNDVAHIREATALRCLFDGAPPKLIDMIFGLTPRDSDFWRTLALRWEREDELDAAAVFWDRYFAHAVAEGLFPAQSPQAGMVRLHAARLAAAGDGDLEEAGALDELDVRKWAELYDNQEPGIAAIGRGFCDETVSRASDPQWLFEQAAAADPNPEVYNQWIAWAEDADYDEKFIESIAAKWHEALPRDPLPLIRLSRMAEKRSALSLALARLAEAEKIDAMRVEVRKARLRLTLAIARRHVRDAKPHLIERDVQAMEKLPHMNEGHKAGLLDAFRCVIAGLREDWSEFTARYNAIVERCGPWLACALLQSASDSGISSLWLAHLPPQPPSDCRQVVRAELAIQRMAKEIEYQTSRPAQWEPLVRQALFEHPEELSVDDLLVLAPDAVASISDADSPDDALSLAYQITAAGLDRAGNEAMAILLAWRAKLIFPIHEQRVAQCVWAAHALAHQSRNQELTAQVIGLIERDRHARRELPLIGRSGLPANVLKDIIAAEKSARTPPKPYWPVDEDVVPSFKELRRGRFRPRHWESDDDVGDFDDEDVSALDDDSEAEEEEEGFGGLPFPLGGRTAGKPGEALVAALKQLSPARRKALMALLNRRSEGMDPGALANKFPEILTALMIEMANPHADPRAIMDTLLQSLC